MTARAGDLGERALVKRFTEPARVADNLLGFADDAAALPLGDGDALVATTDSFREATHYPAPMTWRERGAYAAEATLSDLAAKGAAPWFALLALGVPPQLDAAHLDAFRDGFLGSVEGSGAELAGGDLKPSPAFEAVATALGRVRADRLLRRGGARPTDLVAVTGSLGGAGAGLAALREGRGREHAGRLLAPRARLAEGRALADTRGSCTASTDASDGFAWALSAILRASGNLGAEIDPARIPVADEALAVAGDDRERALEWALHAGGDFELVVTIERTEILQAVEAVRDAGGRLTVVGHVTGPESGAWLVDGEARRPLEARGWEHYRDAPLNG